MVILQSAKTKEIRSETDIRPRRHIILQLDSGTATLLLEERRQAQSGGLSLLFLGLLLFPAAKAISSQKTIVNHDGLKATVCYFVVTYARVPVEQHQGLSETFAH